jgi:hypothetical protein
VRRAAHIDDNQPAIVQALLAAGYSVQSLAGVGVGCPDLVVGAEGINVLMEVKNPNKLAGNAEMKPEQLGWHRRWKGQVCVVHDEAEALAAIRRCVIESV